MYTNSPFTYAATSFKDSISSSQRGRAISVKELYPNAARVVFGDSTKRVKIHDANFAFLKTELAKLHKKTYEPLNNSTWAKDVPTDVGGGFVDYVEYFTVDWNVMLNEFRNSAGNNSNYMPRVNAGMTQNRAQVYTFEVGYDLRFIELEKMKKVALSKSLEQIYKSAIQVGWDLFLQRVAYTGINGQVGLFNNDAHCLVNTIDNTSTTGQGFAGLDDLAVTSFFNGVFKKYLEESNMNAAVLPDTFLVPTFVGSDLQDRMNILYTSTLRDFIIEHNLAKSESDGAAKITINSRPALNTLGVAGKGRIVAYKKDKEYVRLDIPYQMQHYITLPNIERMSYTTAFVGQVSQIQMPYNVNNTDLGIVTYWDFAK